MKTLFKGVDGGKPKFKKKKRIVNKLKPYGLRPRTIPVTQGRRRGVIEQVQPRIGVCMTDCGMARRESKKSSSVLWGGRQRELKAGEGRHFSRLTEAVSAYPTRMLDTNH